MIFTVKEGRRLTKTLIQEAISWNETNLWKYDLLERYYKGEHNILYRKKPIGTKDRKTVINHAKYIVDTNTGYMLGNPIDYSTDEEYDIEPIIKMYKKQRIQKLDKQIAKFSGIYSRQYELVYNDGNEIRSSKIDARHCVVIYDDTVQHKEMYAVVYEKGENKGAYTSVMAYDEFGYYDCLQKGAIVVGSDYTETHAFKEVPVIEYKNNSEYQGDFEQVISLIDAYNLLQSDRINDKEQLVEAILVGYGLSLTKEQRSELRINRTLFDVPKDAKVEYLIKSLDENQVDVLRKTIKDDIHKMSMTPDLTDEKFAGNSSGVALEFKLLHFEWNVSNKIMDFQEGLMKRFRLYNNYLVEINEMTKTIPDYEVDIIFTRNLPQNNYEISKMIDNLQDIVSKKTLLQQLPFVTDSEAEMERKKEEGLDHFGFEVPQYGTEEQTENVLGEEVDQEVDAKRKSLLEKLTDMIK